MSKIKNAVAIAGVVATIVSGFRAVIGTGLDSLEKLKLIENDGEKI